MKKLLFVLLILLLAFGGYIIYDNYFSNRIPRLDIEEETISLDKLFIYGTHLSLHGSIVNDDNLDLVLYNGDFISYDIINTEDGFSVSDKINEGINLEKIPVGYYYAFIRSTTKDENDKEVFRYYAIKNNTDYKETKYYTFSDNNNAITIASDDDYETLTFDVTQNKDTEVYDVVIDPGHGGLDSGASKNGRREADYTMKIATNLKKKMEDNGVKVKLTREDGQLSKDETLPDYGTHGRAVIGHEVNAKYVFSIRLNSNASSYVHGVEIYTADNINYNLADKMAKNIVSMAQSNYSTNKINKVGSGVYTRTFTDYDIKSSLEEYKDRKMEAYDITTNSNYYYMIRETGGIMTGAYVDDRNTPRILENPYYDSNVGCEAYLLELAYLTNEDDMTNIINNMDKYTDAIVNAFMDVFKDK